MANIEGIITSSGKENARRREGAAAKAAAREAMMENDRKRAKHYAAQTLAGRVTVAENELRAVQDDARAIETRIAIARSRAADTGKRDPALADMVFQANEMPALVKAAEDRLVAARDALRQAQEAIDADERADAAERAVEEEMRAEAIEKAERIAKARADAMAKPTRART